MTTTSFSGSAPASASMNVPPSQNTAPVLEYRCMYTQDLRRKQKRWQDGRLKFHTFNKRIMVYDEKGNFVGDTHWREELEFGEGEEVNLERSGLMVEVGECIGKRDQDLTELVDKRLKDKEDRAAAKLASPAGSMFRTQGTPISNGPQPKSLNALLTPSGHSGRALVSGTSPFEERQAAIVGQDRKDDTERPAKRRKQSEPSAKNGYAQNLMGASLNLSSSRPSSTAAIRYEPLKLKSTPIRSEPIDLTMDKSDESDRGSTRTGVERQDSTRISKSQLKKRRSPPEKSGCASHLTGAALSLARPQISSQRRISRNTPGSGVRGYTPMREKSPVDDERSHIIASTEPATHDTAKRSQKPPIPQTLNIPPLVQSSSPPRRQESTSTSTRRPSRAADLNSSDVGPTPDRPMSALRIKSRSGPKMMMLMSSSGSRKAPPAKGTESRRASSTTNQNSTKDGNDIVLSQATIKLNAFCQKQEEAVQARLRKKKRTPVLNLEQSSPPSDDGMDHQTIDRLLSRRKSSSIDDPTRSKPNSPKPKLQRQPSEEKLETSAKDRIDIGSSLASPLGTPIIPEDLRNPLPGEAQQLSQALSGVSLKSGPSGKHSNAGQPPAAKIAVVAIPSPVDEPERVPVSSFSVLTGNSMTDSRSPETGLVTDHRAQQTQAASSRFRALIRSSPGQQHDLDGVPPLPPDLDIEMIDSSPHNQISPPREQPLKTFSELPQPPQGSEDTNLEPSTRGSESEVGTGIPHIPAVVLPPARRSLVNPATGGRSLQSLAANTVAALNSTSDAMAPPPPRISSRAVAQAKGPIEGTRLKNPGAVSEQASDGGPWSREAFDLFGSSIYDSIGKLRAARASAAAD